MSCQEFGASRRRTCSARSGSPSMPARYSHIYRKRPPQDAQPAVEAFENAPEQYGCDQWRAPVLRHRRIPEEYEMPNPGPETEDNPEEEGTSRSEDGETSSAEP